MIRLKSKAKSVITCMAAIALSLSPILYASSVYADDKIPEKRIGVSPVQQKISLEPGDKYNGSYKVINTGSKPIKYRVYATPYSVVGDNYNPDYEATNKYTDLEKWITFSEDGGTLSPGEEHEVNYTIDVPKDSPGGGQYAVLMADTENEENDNIQSVSRVGSILYAKLGGETRIEGEILQNNVPSIVIAPPITASSLVKNTGNVHETAQYILKVFPFGSNEEIYTNEEYPKEITIMPETQRYASQEWRAEDGAPSMGIYTVEQTINFAGKTSTTSKLVIVCPVWLIVIFVALILAIIFTIITRARSRKQSKRESSASRSHSEGHDKSEDKE